MIKQHSWARQQYERAYKLMRREFEPEFLQIVEDIPNDIINAADYSYQAKAYQVTGWINRWREDRFKRFAPPSNDYYGRIPF